jgi:nucleoside-diphosphate-sugar epimerase
MSDKLQRNMIVVVGGSGFIGTRLCKLLALQDVPFRILDKAPSVAFPQHVSMVDVRSVDDLRSATPDVEVLINLAAEHRDDVRPRILYDEVNVQGAKNLCEVAREKNIRKIVFTSSVAVYGFAPFATEESGTINPINDYGRTKAEAEQVFRNWQSEDPVNRTLIIVRPTVVFGEQNRGNVYNLLRQIASGGFVMIGNGENRKSIAYVENVAAFLLHSLTLPAGIRVCNYVDKPDFTMNSLIAHVRQLMGITDGASIRLPYTMGLLTANVFDLASLLTGKCFAISSIRVKKFCANSVYETSAEKFGFVPPFVMSDALDRTIRHEFFEDNRHEAVFFTE